MLKCFLEAVLNADRWLLQNSASGTGKAEASGQCNCLGLGLNAFLMKGVQDESMAFKRLKADRLHVSGLNKMYPAGSLWSSNSLWV